MKYDDETMLYHYPGRSRKGAWIEIKVQTQALLSMKVAPVRERGLKFPPVKAYILLIGRSRKGAWIEILKQIQTNILTTSRSRKGAWIEMGI